MIQIIRILYSIAGETETETVTDLQALLDTPTANWDNMSDTGIDMLSDLPLSETPTDSTVATELTFMQVDTTERNLALPQALLTRTNWTTRRTRMLIQTLIGTDNNLRCGECRRTFSTQKRLKVHIPQHLTVTFCPCGVYHFDRDAILRHQRTQTCYTGHLYEVDADSYTEFRDLILPHVTDPDRRRTLLDKFPATRPTVESDSDAEPLTTETPSQTDIATQPLRVVVTRTGRTITGDDPTPTTTVSYLPTRRQRKRKNPKTNSEGPHPDQTALMELQKMQKRMNKLCKEQRKLAADMKKLCDRLERRVAARP